MVNVSIARATVADIDDLVPLVEKYRSFYKQPANPKTHAYVTDRVTNNEAVVFLARLNREAVGFTMIYPTFSTVAVAPIWLLNDLYVDESARGNGIANQLMDVAEQAARDAGAARIWLRTAHDNAPAQALYEGRGWVQDTVFRRYDLIF